MEELKEKVLEILEGHQIDETNSTGEFTGEKIIYAQEFDDIVNDVCNMIQIVFDPENQPNQLGIKPYKN